ncbi:MAG: hypothetical protein IJE08_09435 [Clostridia bacterium]|nr:hypothetical protein [Clostridia bacterium]
MKNLKTISLVTQNVLFALYIPLSILSWLMGMAPESAIGATNSLYIFIVSLVGWLSVPVALFFFAGMIQSLILRSKGEYGRAMVWQFLPLISFGLLCCLCVLLDWIPGKG